MERYRYHALDLTGQRRSGLIEASGVEDARRLLVARGETPVALRPQKKASAAASRIPREHLADFLMDLAALRDAGVPVRRALDVLASSAVRPDIAQVARLIADRLDAGSDIGGAARLEAAGDLALAAELVRAGEASGRLSEALRFGADMLRRQSEHARKLASAAAYPAFLIVLSLVALVAIAVIAGPALEPLIEDAASPPQALQGLLHAGRFLQNHGATTALCLIMLGAGFYLLLQREPWRSGFARLRARLPVARPLIRDLNCGAFARTLGVLLLGGASASSAIDLAAATLPNAEWRERFLKSASDLREGRTIAGALAGVRGVPDDLRLVAQIGESAGAVGAMLERGGDLMITRALRRIDRTLAVTGPVLVLIMGAGVGWMMSAFLTGLSQLGDPGL